MKHSINRVAVDQLPLVRLPGIEHRHAHFPHVGQVARDQRHAPRDGRGCHQTVHERPGPAAPFTLAHDPSPQGHRLHVQHHDAPLESRHHVVAEPFLQPAAAVACIQFGDDFVEFAQRENRKVQPILGNGVDPLLRIIRGGSV